MMTSLHRDLDQVVTALHNRGDHLNGDPDWRGLYRNLAAALNELDAAARVRQHLLPALLERRWVCRVVRSGYHNGAGCVSQDPHSPGLWGCGWRHEVSLTEEEFKRVFPDEER